MLRRSLSGVLTPIPVRYPGAGGEECEAGESERVGRQTSSIVQARTAAAVARSAARAVPDQSRQFRSLAEWSTLPASRGNGVQSHCDIS